MCLNACDWQTEQTWEPSWVKAEQTNMQLAPCSWRTSTRRFTRTERRISLQPRVHDPVPVFADVQKNVCVPEPPSVLNLLRGPARSGLQQEVQMLMLDFLGKGNEEAGRTTTNRERRAVWNCFLWFHESPARPWMTCSSAKQHGDPGLGKTSPSCLLLTSCCHLD